MRSPRVVVLKGALHASYLEAFASTTARRAESDATLLRSAVCQGAAVAACGRGWLS
jgi:hypothetical protein